jgi:four helix bundle protein
MRNFRELTVWQDSIILVKQIYEFSKRLPREETYGLKNQIQRASVSIPSNIAEGCSRSSEIEFKRFLEIAIGSSFELETQLIIIQELEMIPEIEIEKKLKDIHILQRKLNSFITKLRTNTKMLKANA